MPPTRISFCLEAQTEPIVFPLHIMSSTLQSIANAIPSVGRAKLLLNSADDVVIVAAVRTAVTKVCLL